MLKTERNDIIREYFTAGLTHAEIVRFLARIHDCQISVRQVKCILAASNCMHRKNHSPVEQIVEFIHRQLSTSRKLCGYRFMHKICLKNGIHVPRSMVQEILKLLDPVGVETRRIHRLQRRRYNGIGPNHIWHVDSYDKLKGYGICINGCIDGYSRKLIWLVASKNSNDPRVIAGNYIASIEKERGCPRILRADRGTENVTMGHMQQWLRRNGQDRFAGNKSMLYGRSTANQRMEQWWNFLRRHWAQYWMDIFKTLAQNGHFSGSWLDKNLIQFCFLRKIQDELEDIVSLWDSHIVRPSRFGNGPFGRPLSLYTLPEEEDTQQFLCPVDIAEINACKNQCVFQDELPCDADVFGFCCVILEENNLEISDDVFDRLDLYVMLREYITEIIN